MDTYQLEWVEFRHSRDGLTPTLTNKIGIEHGLDKPRVFSVALDVSQHDFLTVESTEADPITSSEAGAAGSTLGVVLGGAGGYVLGNTVGAVHVGPIGQLAAAAGGTVGIGIGAAVGAGAGYLLGQYLFTGLSLLDGRSQTDKESAFDATKPLIVAELLSDDDLMMELNRRALEHVDKLVRDLGLSRAKPAAIA